MASVVNSSGRFSVRAHPGDAKTLLGFDLPKADAKSLAGFTIQCKPGEQAAYYIYNKLQFKSPEKHAQVASEPPYSSVNAPIHKFRWVHIPGSFHQSITPFFGPYEYRVTPRYFDDNRSLLPLDPAKTVAVVVPVGPFKKGKLSLGFTRGFTQSQAFVNHFGLKALIRPKVGELLFDTSVVSGQDAQGREYTYAEEYGWLGFTARARIFELLKEVADNPALSLDMFAYDLNEPDIMRMLLALAGEGRVRIILDSAALHHDKNGSKPEDEFEAEFDQVKTGKADILRGKFGRYSHDKVFIVSDGQGAKKVLTGSTNFSVTGLYVNSNHVIIFDDAGIAALYARAFELAWDKKASAPAFRQDVLSQQVWPFPAGTFPQTEVAFSPHDEAGATGLLQGVAARIDKEGTVASGNVFFAVMQVDKGTSPVWDALNKLHDQETVYSYGISDSTDGISLYTPGTRRGVLVTGKPTNTVLPPPFSQVRQIGLGHQVHHKFVVCGFNTPNPVVYCGSSNLAIGGENLNGDNLLAIHDAEVVTAFVIEAVALVDHFNFLNKTSSDEASRKKALLNPIDAAKASGWFLSITDKWSEPYYEPKDLHCADRELFR